MKITRFFIRFVLLSLLSIFTFSSCDDFVFGDPSLQQPEAIEVNLDYIFSSKLYAERVLVEAYTTLPYGIVVTASGYTSKIGPSMLDCLTDLLGAKEATPYYTGGVNAALENTSVDTKYSFINEGGWAGIRSAYIFIENVNRVPDMTPEQKKIRIAEAKMIIAVHYTEMFRHFGGLPWLDHAIYPNEDLNFPRITAEQTVNNIVKLIDEAAADLPWALDAATLATDEGRFTKAAALGLKVRLLLFAASPLFNDEQPYLEGTASTEKITWFGGKSDVWWTRAEQACVDFFAELNNNAGSYGIVNTGDPRADFIKGYNGRGTGETLISTRRMYKSGSLWGSPYLNSGATQYRDYRLTKELVDMFDKVDGTPFSWSNPTDSLHPFFDASGKPTRDARLYESAVVEGDMMASLNAKPIETWIGRTSANARGWFRQAYPTSFLPDCYVLRKYIRERSVGNGFSEVTQFPYLRLPEIYLSYAEILNELDKRDQAYAFVSAVRERAGITENLSTRAWTKESFREFILKERATEFFLEDNRWFDIIRWKKEEVFKKRLHGSVWVSETDNGKNIKIEHRELSPDRFWRENFSAKWYLSPLPAIEINKKYGLIQNPGWE